MAGIPLTVEETSWFWSIFQRTFESEGENSLGKMKIQN
jgi:hypothetical protein